MSSASSLVILGPVIRFERQEVRARFGSLAEGVANPVGTA